MHWKLGVLPGVCLLVGVFAAGATGRSVRADDAPSVADDVAMVSPFIGETTVLVVKVDPARLAMPDMAALLKPTTPEEVEQLNRSKQASETALATLRELTGGRPLYATIGIPLSKSEWPGFAFFRPGPNADLPTTAKRFKEFVEPFNPIETSVHNDLVVATPVRNADISAAMDGLVPSPRTELASALEAVAEYPVQVVMLPPDYVRRTVVEIMPQLPSKLGRGPSTVFTDGVVWAAMGFDPATLRAKLVVQSASEEAAGRLAEFVPQIPQLVGGEAAMLQRVVAAVSPTVEKDRVIFRVDDSLRTFENIGLVATLAGEVREKILRNPDSDKFKQILLAMHNYYDVYSSFPPCDKVRDAQGKSGLSWRVYILPFVEEAKLYEEFHLDEPWDSPHNKALIPRIPKVFQSRIAGVAPGHTTFLAPAGEDTVFGGAKASRFPDITDGTSNTLVVVEVKPERAVPWTAPQDYALDPANPAGGLQVNSDGRFLGATADGAVHELRANAPPEQLLRWFQMSDGQPVDHNAVH